MKKQSIKYTFYTHHYKTSAYVAWSFTLYHTWFLYIKNIVFFTWWNCGSVSEPQRKNLANTGTLFATVDWTFSTSTNDERQSFPMFSSNTLLRTFFPTSINITLMNLLSIFIPFIWEFYYNRHWISWLAVG